MDHLTCLVGPTSSMLEPESTVRFTRPITLITSYGTGLDGYLTDQRRHLNIPVRIVRTLLNLLRRLYRSMQK